MTEFIIPKLKTPPPPEKAIIDLDSILFQAASAGQSIWYIAVDENGKELNRFDSAHAYDNYIQEREFMDLPFENITRKSEIELHDVKRCYKAFDRIIKEWLIAADCTEWKGWMSSKAGQRVFRYQLASYFPYKHGREKVEKPYYLEDVRKYARKNPHTVTVKGAQEADDYVVANVEKLKHKGVLLGLDKDGCQTHGAYVMLMGQMDKPVFSSKKIVGKLWKEGKKVFGTGALFTCWQLLKGDKSVDGIVGVPGVGDVKAYNILEKYSGVCISHLPEAVRDVCVVYKDYFGEAHEYNHCYTGEPIVATWRDLFEENLRLLWMLRHKNDKGEFIMQHVPEDL